MFHTKVDVDRSTYKYKEILVEKVFSQVQGVDYHETFAPVAKMDSIHLVLAISAYKPRKCIIWMLIYPFYMDIFVRRYT